MTENTAKLPALSAEDAEYLSLLRELCDMDGVSGYEGDFLEEVSRLLLPYADNMGFDRLGNLLVFRKGKKPRKGKLLFAAHADEVGMAVKHINEDGTLLFDAIGILATALPARRVVVGKENLPGVIASGPIHLVPKADRNKNVTEDDLAIDIGAGGREEAEKHVKVGDRVRFASESFLLSENRLAAKAIDDRAGCAALVDMIRRGTGYDTYFAFTRREELGTVGAMQVAYEIKPDVCIVCEATTAADTFGTPEMRRVTTLGKGAAVPFADGGTVYDRELFRKAFDLAEEKDIPLQTKTAIAGGTDARSFQRSGGGCRVLGVAVPTRYIHSAWGVCDLADVFAARNILRELETELGE